MSVITAIAIYFLIWWVVLFAVLPFKVRSQGEHGKVVAGSDPGAPVIPQLGWKLIWTTLVAGALFGALYFAHDRGWITLERLGSVFVFPRQP